MITFHPPTEQPDPASLTDAELAAALIDADTARSAAEAWELRLLGELDARNAHLHDGALTAGSWLAQRGDVSRARANAMARDARRLRTHPASAAACDTVGTAHVLELLRRVTDRTETTYTQMEDVLLDEARFLTVDDTTKLAQRWAQLADQDGTEPPVEHSEVHWSRSTNCLRGRFTFFDDDASFVEGLLDKAADRIFHTEGDDKMPCGQRRAHALLSELHRADAAPINRGPGRPTIVVHVPAELLLDLPTTNTAEIDPGGRPLTAEAARRLMCDADFHRIITAGNSTILDLGRSQRLITDPQRTALLARDRHCRFTGCTMPGSYCIGHHIQHWTHGGPTNMDNLVLICDRHHHLIHDHHYDIQRLPNGTYQSLRPDRTIITPRHGP